ATIKAKGYNLIFKFVPCTGNLDPSNAECIVDLKTSNNLQPGSISSATWLKRVDRHSPNQKVASLKVVCSSPETANHLLCEKVFIEGQTVTTRKDLCEPLRCNKCQLFGHIRAACKNKEVCAHCASETHSTPDCPQTIMHAAAPAAPTRLTPAMPRIAQPLSATAPHWTPNTQRITCPTSQQANLGLGSPPHLNSLPLPLPTDRACLTPCPHIRLQHTLPPLPAVKATLSNF
ncbi:hypothetical protein BYT27DRAFT_7123052, partial [Phlegmacium glaucopus]